MRRGEEGWGLLHCAHCCAQGVSSVQCPTEIKHHWLANGMRGVGAQGPWGKTTQQRKRVTEADAAVPGEDSRELEGTKRTCTVSVNLVIHVRNNRTVPECNATAYSTAGRRAAGSQGNVWVWPQSRTIL